MPAPSQRLVFFGWGEIFSLFPSTLTDTFGPKHAATGSWTSAFIVVAVLDALTALLAITALQNMRQKHLAGG